MIQNVAQNIAQKLTEKTTEGVGKAGVQNSAQVSSADSDKFMNLMQQTQAGPSSQGQQLSAGSVGQAHSKTIGERILDGIANTAQSQESKYQNAMGGIMDVSKTGMSPGDILHAQVGLMKVQTMQQAEGKVVSKVDQTVENLLKG